MPFERPSSYAALGNVGRVLRQPVNKRFIAVSRWQQNPADVTVLLDTARQPAAEPGAEAELIAGGERFMKGGFGMTETALVRYDAMCRAIVDSCRAKLFLM